MSMQAAELLSIKNPSRHHHHHHHCSGWPVRRGGRVGGAAFCSSFSSSSSSLKFHPILRHRIHKASIETPPLGLGSATVALRFQSLLRSNPWDRSIVAFAASHEDSKHSEIEVEKGNEDVKVGAEESQEAWKQTLDAFKEQALKMQSISQEAYETYSKKATVVLKETSAQLKIQSEKARNDLILLAKEIGEEGKEYLSAAAENYPEPVKEVVNTFSSSTDELNDLSKVKDFHLGIPYGLFLSLGGFLSFMFTGSIAAIRFGVILGGALLALSVSSLRSQKRGQPYALALKGQTAIAAIIFLRGVYLLSQRASFSTFFDASTSGFMVAFYLYRTALRGKQTKGPDFEREAED